MKKLRNRAYYWLRRSERLLKTDMVYVAKGGFWLTIGRVISITSAFVLSIAFANLITPATLGTYKYVLSICSILAIPTLSGLNTAVTQAVARGFDGSVPIALETKIKWGTLGGVASVAVAAYYFLMGNSVLTISFLIAAIFLPVMDSFGLYDALLAGQKNFRASTKYSALSQIFATLAMLAALFFSGNLYVILFAYFFSWTLARCVCLKIAIRRHQRNNQVDPRTDSYGKHLSVMGILNMAVGNINNLLVFHWLGSQNLALFTMAIAPGEQIRTVLNYVGGLMMPKISSDQWKIYTAKTFYKKIMLLLLVLTVGALTYMFLAPWFYKLLYPKYLEAVAYSRVIFWSIVPTAIYILQNSILKAKALIKEMHWLNFLNMGLSLFLVLPLLYFFGLMGMVSGLLIMRVIEMAVANYLIFYRNHQLNSAELIK